MRPTVVKARGCTSTPNVAMYFFSNSPVKWRFTKVVCARNLSVLDLHDTVANKLGVTRVPTNLSGSSVAYEHKFEGWRSVGCGCFGHDAF